MNVQLRYRYRLYPSPGQERALARAFGCARVVFNDALAARRDAYEAGLPYLTDAELSARLTAAKKTPERVWLGEVSSVVLQQALADLNGAYRNFFASLRGERKGRQEAAEVPRDTARTESPGIEAGEHVNWHPDLAHARPRRRFLTPGGGVTSAGTAGSDGPASAAARR